jgi:hypothetical protein
MLGVMTSASGTAAAGTRRRRRHDLWQLVALVLSVAASLLLLVLPVYESSTTSSSGAEMSGTSTLLETQGPGVMVTLAVPILLTAVPLLLQGRARGAVSLVCTLLLGIGTLLALLSIGVFYLPALVCSIAATTAAFRPPASAQPGPAQPGSR